VLGFILLTDIRNCQFVILGDVMASVLAISPKVHGFSPGRGDKNPHHAFLRSGSKSVGPISQDFTAF
jgi:hypothetical protein